MQQEKVIFLNKVLFGIVLVLIIYLGISVILIFTPKEERGQTLNMEFTPKFHIQGLTPQGLTPKYPLSYYKNISSGKLFTPHISIPQPSSSSKVENLPIPEEKPLVTTPKITFQLIGIIWEEGRANALIKSSQDQQTHLVTIGDNLSGYQVVDITSHTVILSNGSERKVVRVEE